MKAFLVPTAISVWGCLKEPRSLVNLPMPPTKGLEPLPLETTSEEVIGWAMCLAITC